MTKPLDLTNKRFGKLVALRTVGNNNHGSKLWLCKCDCGKMSVVVSTQLTCGITKSCGCLSSEKAIKRNLKHGKSKTRLYTIYSGMKQRCYYPKDRCYKNYGAKGITICEEWKDFENFYDWAVKNGYSEGLSIDRIDNSRGYSPDNCRWVSSIVQACNKQNNHLITWKGETHTLSQWSRITGIESSLIRYRLKRGMDLDLVLKNNKL